MARQLHLLVAAALLSSAALTLGEPPEPGPEKGQQEGKAEQRKRDHDAKMSPEFENVRKAIEALTPEQRQRFQDNFLRWSNLPPDQKHRLRDRDEMRRKRVLEEVEQAVKESGLNLSVEERELFTKRYSEERRRIEEQVRREMWEKRKPMIKEMVDRLKVEFARPAAGATEAAPGAEAPTSRSEPTTQRQPATPASQ
jgi:hypothetical protein